MVKDEKSEAQKVTEKAEFMIKLAQDNGLNHNDAVNALLRQYRMIGSSKYYPDVCGHYFREGMGTFRHLSPEAKKRIKEAGRLYDSEIERTGRV